MQSSLYQTNYQCFLNKNAYTKHFSKVLDAQDTSRYIAHRTPSDLPVILIEVRPEEYFHVESLENPKQDIIEKTSDFTPNKKHLFVLFGLGMGHQLRYLRDKYPGSKFLVIEHDAALFKKNLEISDYSDLINDEKIEFAVAMNESSFFSFFQSYLHTGDNFTFLPEIKAVPHPYLANISKGYYDAIGQVISHGIEFYWEVAVGNSIEDQQKGMEQILKNLKNLKKCFALDDLKDSYKDRVGLIVSSGPSLDSKLEFLKQHQDKMLIVCADSALKKLLDYGIKPFAVTAVERDEINAEYLRGFEIPNDVILFCPPLIQSCSFEKFPGPIGLVFRKAFPFDWLPDFLGKIDFGVSCAHLSFKVLEHLGCENIAFIGQDLAYDPQTGSSHFESIHQACTDQFEDDSLARLFDVGNNGKPITTNAFWTNFKKIFENFIQRSSGHHFYNVIEENYGLRIHGTKRIDVKDFFESFATSSPYPQISLKELKDQFKLREQAFQNELSQRKNTTVKEFSQLLERTDSFLKVKNYEEYKSTKVNFYKNISEITVKLFEEYLKPILKRFETNLHSLWREEEISMKLLSFKTDLDTALCKMVKIINEV